MQTKTDLDELESEIDLLDNAVEETLTLIRSKLSSDHQKAAALINSALTANSEHSLLREAYLERLRSSGCTNRLLKLIEPLEQEEEAESSDYLLLQVLSSALANLCGKTAAGPATSEWILEGVSIKVRETSFAECDLGSKNWDSGVVLAKNIANSKLDVNSLDILELGCGTGLTGVICAKKGCSHIVMTDYHEKVLENARHNLEMNECEENATVMKLDWANPSEAIEIEGRKFDLVIAADVIYEEWHANAIPPIIDTYLKEEGTCWIVLPVRERYHAEREIFWKNMRERFSVQQDELHSAQKANELDVVLRTYRRK